MEGEIQEEIEKCRRDKIYFIRTYGRIIEPRSSYDVENKILDFEAYLEELEKTNTLTQQRDSPFSAEQLGLVDKQTIEVGPGGEVKIIAPSGIIPFALWDYQVRILKWFDWLVSMGESGVVEKCRDMGYTWLFVIWSVWNFRFTPGFSALFGSKKEAAVDNGTLASIFGKLDFCLNALPDWLKPEGYDRRFHRAKLRITNPQNGNYLVGDSQNPDFGVSERHTVVFPDETALWDIDPSGPLSNTSNTIVYGSTVRGDDKFKRLRDRIYARGKDLVLTLLWNLNPTHNKAWYDRLESIMDPVDFAREVLINYQSSASGLYYTLATKLQTYLDLEWEQDWLSYLSWDYGVGDDTALIWWQKDWEEDPESELYRMLFCYRNSGKPITFYVPIARAEMPQEMVQMRTADGRLAVDRYGQPVMQKNPHEYTDKDLEFIDLLIRSGVSAELEHRGDPAGRSRNQDTARSIEGTLADYGIQLNSYTADGANSYFSRRTALNEILPRVKISKKAEDALLAIRRSRYPTRGLTSQSTTHTSAPVHDENSHYRSSAEYFALGEMVNVVTSVSSGQEMNNPSKLEDPSSQLIKLFRQRKGL